MALRLILDAVEFSLDGSTQPLLGGVSLDTGDSMRIGIVGPSGIGKTTLFELIAGKRRPTRGSIVLGGRPSGDAVIAYCYQDRRLVPWMSLRDNIGYALPDDRDPALIEQMLARLELTRAADTLASRASGGELARCAIGRALISEPEMLLLDEPLTGLDRRVRDQVIADLLAIQRERCFLLLLISHDIEDIDMLCDQVHVLSGSPARIVRSVDLDPGMSQGDRANMIASISAVVED